MRLTQYSDYALRSLIYLAVKPSPYGLANINDIAESYDISKSHLTKIIHQLSKMGVIESVRGKNGGIRLALPPKDINIGAIIRRTEVDFAIVECFVPQLPDSHNDLLIEIDKDKPVIKKNFSEPVGHGIPLSDNIVINNIEQMSEVSGCVISPACLLRPIFFEATQAFLTVLDRYTLADVLSNQADVASLLK